MLIWLTDYLSQYYSGFNVFQYLTLRIILGILTSLFIALFVGPYLIKRLGEFQIGQNIRHDGPQSHLGKSGTPTMGGLLILVSIAVSTVCWADLSNRFIWVVLLVTLLFGAVGWIDDYKKVVNKNPAGLVKFVNFDLGWSYVVLTYFVIVGTSNAVNLTDGLDGLAILPTVMVAGAFAIFAYATGHIRFSDYLGIPYVPGVGEVAIFCGAMVGSGLGFLWFNTYPAQVFMGDIGALALGAALGVIAVLVRQELVLLIMGGVFVG